MRIFRAGSRAGGAAAPPVVVLLLLAATCTDAAAGMAGRACEKTASRELRTCVKRVANLEQRCLLESGTACAPGHRGVAGALARLEQQVRARCDTAATVADAGHAPLLGRDGLVARLREACRGEVASLVARSFGGPHAAVLQRSFGNARLCLEHAFAGGARVIERGFRLQSECVRRARRGAACDAEGLATQLAREQERARQRIDTQCADLAGLVAIDPASFAAAAATQARCLVATAHGDAAPLALDCGARASVPRPARGVATQVVLPEETWGTRCGDGSPYAFWIRLAPAGQPAERVVVHMQGGGVCVFGEDCADVPGGLLHALDNTLPSGGYMSNGNAASPFRDWTKVFLPYCTQDLHIGGGTSNVFPGRTVHRFGGRNVRAALRYLRDVLWAELDATSVEGYRPDRVQVVFGGGSAGAFGVSYNYHYVLDDLRWRRSTAVPDAGLGLDNGELLGIASLGNLVLPDAGSLAWGARPLFPPYCHAAGCMIVPQVQVATSPRLLAVPEQQILNVSNQVDDTQAATTFFPDRRSWSDAVRVSYCDVQGTPGVRYFLPASATSLHGLVQSSATYPGIVAAGTTLGDWLATAIDAPATLVDRVDEGTLSATLGVQPFACALP